MNLLNDKISNHTNINLIAMIEMISDEDNQDDWTEILSLAKKMDMIVNTATEADLHDFALQLGDEVFQNRGAEIPASWTLSEEEAMELNRGLNEAKGEL